MTQKMTVSPYVDLTSRMSGTTALWQWEVTAVYVNGASNAFTWVDGTLTVTGYTSGVVLAEFTLYLIYDAPSQYLPSDPTDSGSDVVYWENRLTSFFSVSTSIKSFETGLTEVSGGSITIQIDDDWIDLTTELIIFSNRTIRIYTDDVISYKGITTRFEVNNYRMTVQIQKRQTILEAECHWGDPAYLNKIDRTSSNAYYTGSAIPQDYEGYAIPMLFGDQTPYELQDTGEVDLGTPIPTATTNLATKRASRGVNVSSHIVRVIPTSASGGILGRMPNWQSISSVPISETLTGVAHVFTRAEQGSNTVILTKMIVGEVCGLDSPGFVNSARLYNYNSAGTRGLFVLGSDDPFDPADMSDPLNFVNYNAIRDCNENIHYFPSAIPKNTWTAGAISSGTFTPGGHRWVTVSGITGLDLLTDELHMVITTISGERTAVEVMQFALESHGYTVDTATFTALAADLPYNTVQQCGFGTDMPTLGEFLSEINRSLMTVVVFPASNDEPFLIKIDPTQAASQTISESQIQQNSLKFNHEYRDIAKTVEFSPKYARNDAQKTSLHTRIDSSMGTLFAAERTVQIEHVLTSLPTTRFEEMTEVYGSPISNVQFVLLDDDVDLELADCVQLDHPSCSKKILITSITTQPIGRQIQGRFLYVNNS